MANPKCIKCEKELCHLDIAMHRKMINRGATEFMCLPCLALHFKVSEELLHEKAEYFKKSGCTLFLL